MTAAEIASYVSLALAFIFWYLSSRQADSAKKTLDDIKNEILTWQSQLNKAAIDISNRITPFIIASHHPFLFNWDFNPIPKSRSITFKII